MRLERDRIFVVFLYITLRVKKTCTLLLLEVQKPTMTSSDKNTATESEHKNAQDQTFLKALQDLILRVMDPTQTNDLSQIHLSPEAGKLITALQEFISSAVVLSQSLAQNTIEVGLNQEGSDLEDDVVQRGESDLDGEEESSHEEENTYQSDDFEEDEYLGGGSDFDDEEDRELSPERGISKETGPVLKPAADENRQNRSQHPDALEKSQPTFEEKLLRSLREHVFNKMPIRLLCFESQGSSFRISLLERNVFFDRVASSALQGKMDEEEETDDDRIGRLITKYARYAILSHTWLRTPSGEVTYNDWNKGLLNTEDPGYQKLVNFCKAAWNDHQLTFGWMDTVCINKESSSELDESIRSMYNWYSRAAMCITYLAKTGTLAKMYLDPWFTRGWTLQELLAPDVIKFYNSHWEQLTNHSDNDKKDTKITKQIKRATTITEKELHDIRNAPISRRMQLAANRQVAREEDTAYSLMGIFKVSISIAYGEGAPRAFSRLLQEILLTLEDVLDIFNWAGKLPYSRPYTSHILPTSPKHYINRSSDHNLGLGRPIEPLTLTHLGLRIPVVLMPGISISVWDQASPGRHDSISASYTATVDISPVGYYDSRQGIPATYNLLDDRASGADGWKTDSDRYQMTFAVFNFTGAGNIITLPKTCMALGLVCNEPAGEVSSAKPINVIQTDKPISFELSKRNTVDANTPSTEYWDGKILKDELAKYHMQLISLYL